MQSTYLSDRSVYAWSVLKRLLLIPAWFLLIGLVVAVYLGSQGVDIHMRW